MRCYRIRGLNRGALNYSGNMVGSSPFMNYIRSCALWMNIICACPERWPVGVSSTVFYRSTSRVVSSELD